MSAILQVAETSHRMQPDLAIIVHSSTRFGTEEADSANHIAEVSVIAVSLSRNSEQAAFPHSLLIVVVKKSKQSW